MDFVLQAFDAFTRGDIEAVLQMCDDDVTVTQAQELPGVPSQRHGREGVLEAFAYWPQQWDDYRIEVREVIADPGDHVVVGIRERGRGKHSGVEVQADFTFVFTLRDKAFIELRTFVQEDQALEAAGLSEKGPHGFAGRLGEPDCQDHARDEPAARWRLPQGLPPVLPAAIGPAGASHEIRLGL